MLLTHKPTLEFCGSNLIQLQLADEAFRLKIIMNSYIIFSSHKAFKSNDFSNERKLIFIPYESYENLH